MRTAGFFDNFRKNLRVLMELNDSCPKELSAICGFTKKRVNDIIQPNQPRNPTLEEMVKISEHFGYTIDELINQKLTIKFDKA